MATDKERLDWLSQAVYFPEDHPDDVIAVLIPEKVAPSGTFSLSREDDAKAFRSVIDDAMSRT